MRQDGVVDVDIVFLSMNDSKSRVIDQVPNAPRPAKRNFVRRHKKIVVGNVVLLQPCSRAIVSSPHVTPGTDDDSPLVPSEPLHEFDTVRARASLLPTLQVYFETAIVETGAHEIDRLVFAVTDELQITLEHFSGQRIGRVVGKLALGQRFGEIVKRVVQIDCDGPRMSKSWNQS